MTSALGVIRLGLRDWWDAWVNLEVVTLAWLLSWFTIVLGPPATFGLYYVANQLAHGPSLGLGGLWIGIKRYFALSWLWMVLNVIVGGILGANFWFYSSVEAWWARLLLAFVLFLGLTWLVVQFYALPFVMEQEHQHLGLALRNGLFTALSAPVYTLIVGGLALVVAALSIGFVLPLLVGGPALIACLGNRAVMERLDAYRVRERDSTRRKL